MSQGRMDRTRLLKRLDDLFGGMAVRLLPAAPRTGGVRDIRSILLIRPGGAGDAVLLIPTVQALQKSYPGACLDILAEKRNCGAFALATVSGAVLCYDRPRDLLAVLRRRYDLIIDSEQWYRLSAVVARICRGAVRVGFATNERRRLFTHPVPYPEESYEADSFLRLAAAAGAPGTLDVPFLRASPDALSWARSLPAVQGGAYVVLFPGASLKEKQWPSDRFVELARFLVGQGRGVVVVGGRAETKVAEQIARMAGGENLAGQTDLSRTAAIVAGAEAVVSGDSVVLHLAAGLAVPTVALFGPTSVAKWAPSGEKHLTVTAGAPCAPCARYGAIPGCRAAAGCMEGISVEQVIAALRQIII